MGYRSLKARLSAEIGSTGHSAAMIGALVKCDEGNITYLIDFGRGSGARANCQS